MKIYTALAAGAALMFSASAQADAHMEAGEQAGPRVFSMTGTLTGSVVVGGVGGEEDQAFGVSWTETQTITSSNGNVVSVTAKCVGMDQPSNSLFDRHFTCTMDDGDGQKAAALYGCNIEGDSGSEMSCVGYMQGKEGEIADHVSLQTAYYWFMPGGTGKVEGSGHWIR